MEIARVCLPTAGKLGEIWGSIRILMVFNEAYLLAFYLPILGRQDKENNYQHIIGWDFCIWQSPSF